MTTGYELKNPISHKEMKALAGLRTYDQNYFDKQRIPLSNLHGSVPEGVSMHNQSCLDRQRIPLSNTILRSVPSLTEEVKRVNLSELLEELMKRVGYR